MVGTPIGNLKDITIRALEVLKTVDTVFCEDTRRTRKLLSAWEISARLVSLRAQNEEQESDRVIRVLRDGKDAAYASDAGTPGLSDPGSLLCRKVREAGFPVVPIPGPSAFGALSSVGSFGGKSILFEGFLSPKGGKRRSRLAELLQRGEAFVVYESPYRILKLLDDLSDLSPEQPILLGREMTKLHEEFLEGTAGDVAALLRRKEKIQGEFSVLVSGKKKG